MTRDRRNGENVQDTSFNVSWTLVCFIFHVFKLLILFLVTTSAHNTRASHTNTRDPRDHDPLVAYERSTHRIRQEHTTMTDDGLGLEL